MPSSHGDSHSSSHRRPNALSRAGLFAKARTVLLHLQGRGRAAASEPLGYAFRPHPPDAHHTRHSSFALLILHPNRQASGDSVLDLQEDAKSDDAEGVLRGSEEHDHAWRKSKFVPPPEDSSAPKAARRGLSAVFSRVTQLASLLVGDGAASEPAPHERKAGEKVEKWREKGYRAIASEGGRHLTSDPSSARPIDEEDPFPLVSVDEERLFVDSSRAVEQLQVPPRRHEPIACLRTAPPTTVPGTTAEGKKKSGEARSRSPMNDGLSRLWHLCDGDMYGPLLPAGWAVCSCEIPVKIEWASCPRCGATVP